MQTEDEIAAISMAIGASYAGRVAVTGSSGPGIALKSEAAGWGGMAGVPVICIHIPRGGRGGGPDLSHRHPARRAVDRHADQRGTVGPEHRLLRQPWRFPARRAG